MSEELKKALARREKEEALLCFDHFSNEDALALGLKVVEKAKERGVSVAVGIDINGTEMFHYTMTGASQRLGMWVKRKQNTVRETWISTYHVHQQLIHDGKDLWKNWRLNDVEYGSIGGGFPITIKGTGVVGSIACSGLPHEEDHQLLVDALCDMLGVDLDAE